MAALAGLKKLVIPGGKFQDPDLYLSTDELKWFGTTVIAKVFRRSRPLREVFYLAWTTDKIAKKYGPDESDEQAVFVSMARSAGCTLHSIPNGGFRDMETATKMKREGMSPGAPDLVVITGNPVDPMNGVPIGRDRVQEGERDDRRFRALAVEVDGAVPHDHGRASRCVWGLWL